MKNSHCILQFSRSVLSDSLRPHESQHPRPLCPSPTPGIYSNSSPSSQWCHPTISSPVTHFCSCPPSFPALGSFAVSWLFALSGQSIGASAFASVLLMNIQCWFPLGLTSLISLLSKGLPRILPSITSWRHQPSVLCLHYGPILTSIHDYWKNHILN